MLATGALALGLVLIVEGLVYALAPHAIERMLEAFRLIPLRLAAPWASLRWRLGSFWSG